jgi:putative tricarboxylic transport membrane protein
MGRRDAWSAGVLALLAVIALVESARLDVGSPTRPGPGFFPLVLAVALLLVAGVILARAWGTRSGGPADAEAVLLAERADPRRLMATLVALAIYVAVLEPLGFMLSTVALLTFLFGALARYHWPVALGLGTATALVAWLVFDTWLQVRLPSGVLGRW